ncbi:MAG: PHP domain-containing protein [Acidithiobacillus sp.]|jgi:DNA polymerase-3 subunit alpha|uniref:PHP domain-containing protein n=1 Tax=Acidithiobacillus sp. TaxID=1872118 RepID=UPI003560EC00
MDNKNFVHLHVHTSFSIKDGVAGIDDYIKKCEEYQMPAVAITDHGSIGGFPKFYVSTRESSIKPIFGVEVYVQNERDKLESVINDVSKFHEKVKEIQKLVNTKKFTKVQWDKNPKILMKAFQIDNIDSNMIKECNKNIQNGKRRLKKIQEIYQQKYKETTEIRDRLRRNTHLILLAKNKEGFRNIIKICNDASVNGFYYKPRTSIDFISKNKDGLIVSSACLAGPLCQIYWKYKDNDKFDEEKIFEEMVNTAKWYKETFEIFILKLC